MRTNMCVPLMPSTTRSLPVNHCSTLQVCLNCGRWHSLRPELEISFCPFASKRLWESAAVVRGPEVECTAESQPTMRLPASAPSCRIVEQQGIGEADSRELLDTVPAASTCPRCMLPWHAAGRALRVQHNWSALHPQPLHERYPKHQTLNP